MEGKSSNRWSEETDGSECFKMVQEVESVLEIRFTSLITVGKDEGQVMMSAETSLPLTGIILEHAFRCSLLC